MPRQTDGFFGNPKPNYLCRLIEISLLDHRASLKVSGAGAVAMSKRTFAFSDHRVSTARLSGSIVDEFFSPSSSDLVAAREVDLPNGVVKRRMLPVKSLRSLHNQKHMIRHSSSLSLPEEGDDNATVYGSSSMGTMPLSPISKNANANIGNNRPAEHKEKLSKITFRVEGCDDCNMGGEHRVTLLVSDAQVRSFHETNLQNIVEQIFHTHDAIEAIQMEMLRFNAVELCARLKKANSSYTTLLESVMSEMLIIQRAKTKSQSELKKELTDSKEKLIQTKENLDSEKTRSERFKEEIERLNSNARSLQAEMLFLKERIDDLETVKMDYDSLKRSTKCISDETDRRIREITNSIQMEEKSKFDRIMQQTRKKMLREVKAQIEKEMVENKERLQRAAEEQSFRDVAAVATKKDDFKRPKVDGSSQTEVDECGIWDKTDGWTLPISGTVLARQQWRRAILFAKCPSCKGIGRFIGTAAKLFRLMQRGQTISAIHDVDLKKRAAKWSVPDSLVQFMCNLPRSVQAMSSKGKSWVVRRVFKLLQEKKIAADMDDSLGYSVQPLTEFVIEYYLTRSSNRTTAEIELLNLITTLKERHKSHSLLQTFCRFLQLLDSYNDKEIKEAQKRQKIKDIEDQKKREKELASMNPRERTRLLHSEKDLKREEERQSRGKAAEARGMAVTDCALTIEMMSVYLYARACMMHEYAGIYSKGIRDRKQTSAVLQANETKLTQEEGWRFEIPAHICICENLKFWIPIDRVLRVMQPILSDLDDETFTPILRSLEQNARMLTTSSTFNAPEGMRTAVRTIIRRVQLAVSEDGRDLSWHEIIGYMERIGKPVPESEASFLRMLADYDFETPTFYGEALNQVDAIQASVGSTDTTKAKTSTKSNSTAAVAVEESEKGLESADVQRRFREDMLMVDMDFSLQLLIEALITRAKYVEGSLGQIFKDGDENGDGVLTFKEFVVIVSKVAPHFHERRILKMFREALTAGDDNESIDPDTFIKVCKMHGLVQLVDIVNLKSRGLKALSVTAISKAESEAAKILANAKLMAEAQIAAMVASHHIVGGAKGSAAARSRKASVQAGFAGAGQGSESLLKPIVDSPAAGMKKAIRRVMNVQKLMKLPKTDESIELLDDLASAAAAEATINISPKLPSINLSSSTLAGRLAVDTSAFLGLMEPDDFDRRHSNTSSGDQVTSTNYSSASSSVQSSPIMVAAGSHRRVN